MSDSLIHSVAGAGAGILAMTATYPLVFLSTRAAVRTRTESKSMYEVVTELLEKEGILGLYSGLSSSLLGIAVTNGVYYYFYERSRGIILKSRTGSKGLSAMESILTGLIAGSATTIISNPIWVVQTSQAVHTMDSENTAKPGLIETTQNIVAKAGVKGLWRGLGPALVLVVNPVIQYTVFEQIKNFLVTRRKGRRGKVGLSDWDFFILGALSKLVATSVTYPYIVIKARLQAGAAKYKSSWNALLTILKTEGVEGLFKGIASKLVQSVLTAAFLFACQRRIYLVTKTLLNK